MKVNVLGTTYKIIEQTIEQNESFNNCDGFIDVTAKKIYIRDYTGDKDFELENIEEHRKEVIRHEIIHAFFQESGLWHNSNTLAIAWAMNEELVDWFAIQSPKIYKAFATLNVL